MKEIQGKIKFAAIPLNNGMIGYLPLRYEKIGLLSEITEEQAAEFVEYYYINGDYKQFLNYNNGNFMFKTAKESLISLLKANDVWIKKWSVKPKRMTTNALSEKNKDRVLKIRERLYGELPDDLLLIKLT